MRDRRVNRSIAVLVLLAFTMSLGAPIVEAQAQTAAQQAPASSGGALAGAVNTAKNSLSFLWKAWATRPIPPGTNPSFKPSVGEAFNFFRGQGATVQQAEILANNASISGQVSSAAVPASQAPQSLLSRIFGRQRGAAPQPEPIPAAGESAAAKTAQAAEAAAAGGQPQGFLAKIRAGWDRVVLGGKRSADTAAQGVKTAALSAKNVFDFNRYYELPLTDNSAIKFRGEWQSTVKFTDGKWVVSEVNSASKWPAGVIKSGDAVARLEQLSVGAKDGSFTEPAAVKAVGKIKSSISNLRDKIFGSKSKTLGADSTKELSKLEIQGHMLEQSRAIVDAQKAIESRITDLQTKAARLQKPVPAEEIAALEKGYKTLEAQKQELQKRLDRVGDSPANNVMKDAAKWALYSVGITAGINIIRQVASGEGISLKRAFEFVKEPSFWGGTAGGFVGSMLFQTIASSFMPPGAGIFFRVLPGFLGAALGFEAGSSVFGGGSGNWAVTIGQTIASAGGYALAYSLLGGAAAPGIALIGASIAAGAVASFLLGKLFGGGPEATVADLDRPIGPVANELPAGDFGGSGAVTQPPMPVANIQSEPAAAEGSSPSVSAAAAAQEMKMAYNEYINHLKERKVADARTAYDRYVKAKEALDVARQQAQ